MRVCTQRGLGLAICVKQDPGQPVVSAEAAWVPVTGGVAKN